jgi:hypothetical protein
MPMLFWLPMIIFSGMWTMAVEAASGDASLDGDEPRGDSGA